MESAPMPGPLRQAMDQTDFEAVRNRQEALRYVEPGQAHARRVDDTDAGHGHGRGGGRGLPGDRD